jgi:hypothetical protein
MLAIWLNHPSSRWRGDERSPTQSIHLPNRLHFSAPSARA